MMFRTPGLRNHVWKDIFIPNLKAGSSRNYTRFSNTHHHHHFTSNNFRQKMKFGNQNNKATLPVVLGITSGVASYLLWESIDSNKIMNASTVIHGSTFRHAGFLSNSNHLTSDPNAETFEIGLYMTSQRELEEENERNKQRQMNGKLWFVYKLKYFFLDHVWENFITVIRFLEIGLIFTPVAITYPICWFGRRHPKYKNERSGSALWYKILRHAIEIAGASFIKLGQWSASRTDIFPDQMCDELSQLHSNAKAHSLHMTKRIICKTFGIKNFDDIFEKFIEHPVGVGAIAQVYVAKLNADKVKGAPKSWVAIKVLHPNVEIKIERDLRIMKFFANAIDLIPTMEWLSLPQEVEQFSLLMKLQLDLRIEGANLQKFTDNFKQKQDIHFPTPFMNISGREVLVEEYINGVSIATFLKIANPDQLPGKDENKMLKELSDKVLDSFLQMLILDNFVHADLHPGNIIVNFYKTDHRHKEVVVVDDDDTTRIVKELLEMKDDPVKLNDKLLEMADDGYHARVCYIDAGLVTELNKVDRVNFIELFNALSEFDGYRAGELMIERSRTPETVVSNEIFALKVERLVDRIKQRTFTLGNLSIGDLLDQVLGMVRQHHVRMEGDFVTVIVAILLLEGIGRQLDPNLDLFASALPVLRKLGLQDGKFILQSEDSISMLKVWLALEIRQFIHASIQDIHVLVKSDGLCPNY